MGNNKTSKLYNLSDEEFKLLVLISDSFLDIKRRLGYSSSSGGVAISIKKRVINLKIDTSHFTRGQINRIENLGNLKYSMAEILVKDSNYLNRGTLKKRLVDNGLLEYKCIECDNDGTWNGKKLSLQLDHKNGINNDNRIENLRFLCPNCHSQTDNFSGKNCNKD